MRRESVCCKVCLHLIHTDTHMRVGYVARTTLYRLILLQDFPYQLRLTTC